MSLARALLEAQVGTSTLVIHLDDRSTDFLKPIYDGNGYPVVTGHTTPNELLEAIEAHDRVYGLGHGSPSGLFARGFMIDDRFGPALAKKQSGLYIWCNADAYAVRNKLSGLVSGMFISEVLEARMFGIQATQEEVTRSNDLFSKTVREILDRGESVAKVRECYTHATCQIVKFNSERLYVFENGVPSPALHPTSLGIEKKYSPEKLPPRYRQGEQQPAEEVDWDFDTERRSWFRELYRAGVQREFPLHTLNHQEEQYVEDLFMDGYQPEEAIDWLWQLRQAEQGGT